MKNELKKEMNKIKRNEIAQRIVELKKKENE